MKKTAHLTALVVLFIFFALTGRAQTNSIELKSGSGTLISSYSSITDAIAAIPSSISQAYVIEITGTYTGSGETYPITFTSITGASASNTITLRPATGVTNAKLLTSTTKLMLLDGADYVIIDGRPGGIGTTSGLTIDNTSTGGTSAIDLDNGAEHNIISYCTVAQGSTIAAGMAINISSSGGNSYNLIEHCTVDGSKYGIRVDGNIYNPNTHNTIYGNEIFNNYFTGIWVRPGVEHMVIDSNEIHYKSNFVSIESPCGILFDSQTDSSWITRNKIYDIDVLGNNDIIGINIRSVSSPCVSYITNNFISLTKSNESTKVYGIDFNSNSVYSTYIYYNTIKIGGSLTSATGSSGDIVSATIHKDQGNTGSNFNIRNNISVNDRTGGNAGVQHVTLGFANVLGNFTIDYNTYNSTSGDLTRWGPSVYTTLAGHQAAVPTGNELNSNSTTVNLVSNTDLHVTGNSLGDFDLKAFPILLVTNDIDNDERGASTYRGADDNLANPILGKRNEIGVVSVDAPLSGACSGNQTVKVTVRNYGINQVDTFTVNWSLNGVLQTPIVSYAVLDTVLGTGLTTASVTVGNFTASAGTVYDIDVWTSLPNNLNDPDKTNDSSETSFKLGLAGGAYTIGGSTPDFATIQEAADELNNYGICGAVTFDIRKGTYNEQVVLNEVAGVSATNTITFRSESGNRADVTISAPASGSGTDNFVLFINGTDYISFKHLTMERTGTGNYATVVSLEGKTENILITNNTLRGPYNPDADFSGIRCNVFASKTSTLLNVIVSNNILDNNSNGVWFGTNTSDRSKGVQIYDNEINPNYTGIFIADHYYPEIVSNNITRFDKKDNLVFYGISLRDIDSAYLVSRNKVDANKTYGIRLRNCYGYTGNEGKVINNMVTMNYTGTSTIYGITNESGGAYQLFAHNTVLMNVNYSGSSTTSGARAFYMPAFNAYNDVRILNNIFYNAVDGVAAYFRTSSINGVTEMNYNLYYSANNLTYISEYQATLADHQIVSGMDANSYNFVPSFVSNTNPHIILLQKLAFGRNGLNISEDFDGDPRCSSLPTIGADEYSSSLFSPIAAFKGPNNPVTSDRAYFLFDGDANQIAIYKWYINGVFAKEGLNLTYKFPSTGSYEIKLVAENCGGIDSTTNTYNIANPTAAPTANFSADRNQTFTNDAVKMTDLSTVGPTAWHWSISPDNGTNFIFSDSTEQDPTIIFTETGKYEVCLIADNGAGSSAKLCRTSFIEVYPQTSMCLENTTTYEKGKIFDDGGDGSNYGSNKNCTYLINPCASEVNLKINSWTVTDVDDKLTIYNGDTGKTNLIAVIDGSMDNPGGTTGFTAKSGRMLLVWETDGATQNDGFEAEWTSVPASITTTVANFDAPDTAYINSPVDFKDASSGNGLIHFWDFDYPNFVPDDDNSYVRQNPSKTFTTAGTYTVFLESTNCAGSDTTTKQVVVVAPTVVPTPDFTATLTKVNTKQITRLQDLSENGSTSWRWEVTPSNGVLFLDSETSRNPRVLFNFRGNYTVKLVAENSIGSDSVTKTNFIKVLEYCSPNVLKTNTDVTIRRVVFEGIDQSSDYGVNKYTDFTDSNQIGQLAEGGTYSISIERNTNNEVVNFAAWIDFNQDGDFEDANERVLFDSASSSQVLTTSVTIPSNISLGTSRLRVGVTRANFSTAPCGSVVVGEYEDYKVIIGPDDLPPVITLVGPAAQAIELGYGFTDSGATAFDNVDGNITSKIVVTGTVDTTNTDQYILTYTVKDTVGNTTSVQRIVTITPDVTKPIVTLTGADTVKLEVFDPYLDAGATGIDNPFGTNLTPTITGAVDTTKIGTYVLTYTFTDASGNSASIKRVVIVEDLNKPVITLNGSATTDHDVNTPFVDPMTTVTDNYDNFVSVTVTGSVDVNVLGIYTLVYKATDASGNVADSVVRTVNVIDRIAPEIHLVGSDIVNLARWQNYTDASYTLGDNFYDSTQVTVDVLGTFVDAGIEGSYYIQYRATDLSGNISLSEKRFIDVRGTNSVRDIDTKNTSVYPNPSAGSFTIEANKAFEAGTVITITNTLGAKIYETKVEVTGSNKLNVKLQSAGAGVYFVNISNGSSTEITKIVIR